MKLEGKQVGILSRILLRDLVPFYSPLTALRAERGWRLHSHTLPFNFREMYALLPKKVFILLSSFESTLVCMEQEFIEISSIVCAEIALSLKYLKNYPFANILM